MPKFFCPMFGAEHEEDAQPCPLASGPGCTRPVPEARWGPEPDILFVGEYPSSDDDVQGLAFRGRSAVELSAVMRTAGIAFERCQFSYAVRCYPGPAKPKVAVYNLCRANLEATLASRQWAAVVPLGARALKAVLPNSRNLTDVHGQPLRDDRYGHVVFPTFSPAAAVFNPQAGVHIKNDLTKLAEELDAGTLGQEVPLPDYPWYGDDRKGFKPLLGRLHDLAAMDSGLVCFDLETTGRDPFRDGARIVSVAFARIPGTAERPDLTDAFAFALYHRQAAWTPEEQEELVGLMRAVLENPNTIKVGHNVKFDCKWVDATLGIKPAGQWLDTMLSAHLIAGGIREGSLSLKAQVYKYPTGMGGYEDGLDRWKLDHWQDDWDDGDYGRIPLDPLIPYNAADVDATLRVLHHQLPVLAELGLDRLFVEHTMSYVPTLCDMEVAGTALNDGALAELMMELPERTAAALARLRARRDVAEWERMRGLAKGAEVAFNPNSPKQMVDFLYNYRRFRVVSYTKSTAKLPRHMRVPSVDKTALATLQEEYPRDADLFDAILAYRQVQKLYGGFVRPIRTEHTSDDGMIHGEFNAAGTDTGRPSSKNPNLLNIPTRGAPEEPWGLSLAKRVQSCFCTRFDDGYLIQGDLSQIEPRVVAALSRDPFLLETYQRDDGGDIHKANAVLLFGYRWEDVDKPIRDLAKTIGLAILYGTQAPHLADLLTKAWHDIGRPRVVSVDEAQQLIDLYWARLPAVRAFKDESERMAVAEGLVRNAFGRIRYIPGAASDETKVFAQAMRQAVNTRVQSTASDILLSDLGRVGNRIRRSGMRSRVVLSVYDSIVVDAPADEVEAVEAILEEEMTDGLHFPFMEGVPLKADIEKDRTWGGWDESLSFYPEPKGVVRDAA